MRPRYPLSSAKISSQKMSPLLDRIWFFQTLILPVQGALFSVSRDQFPGRVGGSRLSRFEVFEIPAQDRDTKLAILKRLCKEFKDEYFGVDFSDKVLDALVDKTPREQRQLLQRAVSRTVRLGENVVCLDHLEQVAPRLKQEPPKKAIGYL